MIPSDSMHNNTSQLEFRAWIDRENTIKTEFAYPKQLKGNLYVLCTRGECKLSIHLSEYTLLPNTLAVGLTGFFVQVIEQSDDCELYVIEFNREMNSPSHLFASALEVSANLVEKPVLRLHNRVTDIFKSYFNTLVKICELPDVQLSLEQQSLFSVHLILGIGNIRKKQDVTQKVNIYNRGDEIVKMLVRLIIKNYHKERSVNFYAEQMHLSPQHLSTTVKKVTGKTITDIISALVVRDAQAKLKSTELTIQEIAYSLNFPDISFFGKYFKRYTGMSPKQYRNT